MSNTQPGTPGLSRVELMRKDVSGESDLEAILFVLSLGPGGSSPAHWHPGVGLGYVLEGVYESQYQGEELKRFTAGDAVYDLAQTPHLISRNGSDTETLRLLLTFVVPKGEPTILPL